uniref:Na driven multidrug efflux pump n=1 Tax=uncultured bacterium Contig575 TaxID=1393592 RepID=W0FHX1_9BACT|nr:Na driven multidrug efflux pump [uncultured bacterium Contig575]
MEMDMEKTTNRQFGQGNPIPEYFRLALPVVLGSIVTIVYNLADTYFIAQNGSATLIAGVSVCAPIFMILMAFGNIFGQGGSSLISRLLGQRRTAEAGNVSAFCFWIALLTGAVIGMMLLLIRDPFLSLLGASEDTMPFAREYGTVLLLGAPFIVVNFIHMNLLRCEGMPGISMLGTVIGAAVNVVLDPLLIRGMGAAGAALATVIGYLCADAFLLTAVLRRSAALSVRPTLRTKGSFLSGILSIGVTAAITNIASSVCTMLLNQRLLPFGDDRIAAMGIVLKVTMIVQMILVGFSFGGIPLFGFLSGAGEREKIRGLFRFCFLFLCALSLSMTLLVSLAATPLLGLISPDQNLVSIGTPMLRWHVAGSVFAGMVMLTTCICQATGRAAAALALSLSRQGVLFAAVLLIFSMAFGYQGIIRAQFAADALSAILTLGILRFVVFSEKGKAPA